MQTSSLPVRFAAPVTTSYFTKYNLKNLGVFRDFEHGNPQLAVSSCTVEAVNVAIQSKACD